MIKIECLKTGTHLPLFTNQTPPSCVIPLMHNKTARAKFGLCIVTNQNKPDFTINITVSIKLAARKCDLLQQHNILSIKSE